MDGDFVLYIGGRMLETALVISAPVLLSTLAIGIVVAMLQAITSIRDMTMGMILKLACVAGALIVAGGWMLDLAVAFTNEIFNHMQAMGH